MDGMDGPPRSPLINPTLDPNSLLTHVTCVILQVSDVLSQELHVVSLDMDAWDPESNHLSELKQANVVMLVICTYGSGAPPPAATP